MKAILLLALVGCVPANYAKDLDKCALDNVGNKPAIHECQCAVSQNYGRSCDWLKADGVDASISEGGAQ